MKLAPTLLGSALLLALAAPAAHAEIAIDVIGGSEVSLEGLVQADGNWFHNDVQDLNGAIGANGDNSEFSIRRAELVLKGKGPGNVEWVLGYDPSVLKQVTIKGTTVNSTGRFLDTNVKYKFGGNANNYLQIGQFKQPNSLEELSSTKNNDFVSKASVTNTYGISRRLGVAYGMGDNNWSVTASAFGRELTRNQAHGSGYGARGTWAPINETGNVLHFGLSYLTYDTDDDTLRLRARPDADLTTVRLIDSGAITNVDNVGVAGAEAMWITGPFKLQSEYFQENANRIGANAHDYKSDGWYVSGVWNLTGETWGYKAGVPTTPLPNEPASGMWQLAVRYDTLDLNDGHLVANGNTPFVDGVLGGKMNVWTVGANWYWRSNFKFALDYAKVDSTRYNNATRGLIDDNPSIIEARAQFYW
ncbi:OprO/OprP family phosphate-selective porin [Xanthomonas prunicola]|uniref:OprO/OprP family phosphate-selective porin n=1 Tax=Xanthomonas prunicola TaxID=2053930 RepID=UPI0021B3A9DC|nr:OprO/OprP family phosphate-selective porin [Xanthomonas prunicola]UXA69527.1 OprO/OprP family phosphate-selective porin [Xanthomonas prunicola]